MLKEVRFRYEHEGCWLQEATQKHPDLLLVVSSVYSANGSVVMTLTVHAEAATVPKVEAEWRADERISTLQRLHEGPRGVRYHVTYSSPHSIFHHIVEHTPVSIGVIRVAGGVEHYQLVGETQAIQETLEILGRKGRLEVESIRTPGEEEPEKTDIWDSLTDKQVEALVLARLAGYYQWPRNKSASALAQSLGLSSSAFLDQLRHAEGKLITGLVDALRKREPGRVETIQARLRKLAAASA